uniref:Uncharacterized protein n=1 Tax=Arundo donax TaxID=35708 RepID=A0A0A9FXH7_ARUDO
MRQLLNFIFGWFDQQWTARCVLLSSGI